MKKAFLFVLFLFSVILTASAQHKVSIKLLDGTVHKYLTTDIEEILFDEDDQDESDGPKVPYTHAVDLGLSVKWADMNVGAEGPEGYGSYFAWGETEEKDMYNWETYFDYGGANMKYSTSQKEILDVEDDVARVNWGGEWRMPTYAEMVELRSKCSWTWDNGHKGYKITGPNGNSIFLPAAGYYYYNSFHYPGRYGSYWSSSLNASSSEDAYRLEFDSEAMILDGSSRFYGLSVRAVCATVSVSKITLNMISCSLSVGETLKLTPTILPENATNKRVEWISSNSSIASVAANGTVTAKAEGKVTITCAAQDGSGVVSLCELWVKKSLAVSYTHAVDLGLSVKWADMNVGAESPEDYGSYFAWGETEEKDAYSRYKYFDPNYEKYETNKKSTLNPEDDAAAVNWGGDWRMPTHEEITELLSKCTWAWTWRNGVYGRLITGPNGNSIFIPAAGFRYDSYTETAGSGYYWSRSLIIGQNNIAYCLAFSSSYVDWSYSNRYYGLSVRAVCP